MAEIKPRLSGQPQLTPTAKTKSSTAAAAPSAPAAAANAKQIDAGATQRAPSGPQSVAPRAATPLAGAFTAPTGGAKGASFSNPQPVRAREGSAERTKNDLETQAMLAEIRSRPAQSTGGMLGVFRRKSPSVSASERNELLAYKSSRQSVPELQRKLVAVDNLRAIDELLR